MTAVRQIRPCERLPVGSRVGDHQHHVLLTFVALSVGVSRTLDVRLTVAVDVDAARIGVNVAGEVAMLHHGDQPPVVAVLAGAGSGLDDDFSEVHLGPQED